MATEGRDLLSASSVTTSLTSLTRAQLEALGRACRFRDAVSAGSSRAELANKYGVNVETIHRIVRYASHREEVMPDVVRNA